MTTPDDTATTEPNRPTTDDASPRQIPGRTPITEEAGAPLVPRTRTEDTGRPGTDSATGRLATDSPSATPGDRFETLRRRSPPPTEAERDAPLVPDLRPARRPRTDGGSQ